jgi:anti-sigma factor RsiW
MNRHLSEGELVGLVFSELSAERRAACRRHMTSCLKCREANELLERAVGVLRQAPQENAPPFAWSRLEARIDRSRINHDWTEPDWLPLVLGHAAGIFLILALINFLGSWLDTPLIWDFLSWWRLARTFGPYGLAALVVFGLGVFAALAMVPIFWWEARHPIQRYREEIH